jgi:hypothetical protein
VIELALVLIVVAMVLMSVALASRNLTYGGRALMCFIAAGMSACGAVLAFLSRI